MLPVPEPGRRKAAFVAVVLPFAAGYYISYLFRTVNAVIAPELTSALGLGPADLGLLTSTYFLTFALAQVPVGVALDRWGARRVVSALLLVAGLGAAVFASGRNFAQLAVGRALIGVGVSACLMGGLKVLAAGFPVARQASLTGLIMSAGAFGALTASLPLEWALPYLGWRGAVALVAAVSLAVALGIFVAVPHELTVEPPAETDVGQLQALRGIARTPVFWRFAAQAGLFTGGFMALQGLWAGPFLMTVAGRSRAGAAAVLLLLNLGMLSGQLAISLWASALGRAGITRQRLMGLSLSLALLAEAVIVVWPHSGAAPWFALGFFSAASAQVYGVAASFFPLAFSARVSTAVNQFAFVGAFVIQWGLGAVVEAFSQRMPAPSAFRVTLGLLWLLQVAAVGWSMMGGRTGAPTMSENG